MNQARTTGSEAHTRAERIDRQLAKAGWAVSSSQVMEELWLPGDHIMAEPPPRRLRAEFVDYALMTPDGRPIAIVEAFRDKQGELCMRFVDRGNTNTPRIQSLDHILQLQGRWRDRLRNRVSDSIVDSLRHQLRSARRRGEPEGGYLENVRAQRQGAHESRGKRPDSILCEAFFSLIEADPTELAALST